MWPTLPAISNGGPLEARQGTITSIPSTHQHLLLHMRDDSPSRPPTPPLTTGSVIGIVVGVFLALGILGLGIWFSLMKRKMVAQEQRLKALEGGGAAPGPGGGKEGRAGGRRAHGGGMDAEGYGSDGEVELLPPAYRRTFADTVSEGGGSLDSREDYASIDLKMPARAYYGADARARGTQDGGLTAGGGPRAWELPGNDAVYEMDAPAPFAAELPGDGGRDRR